MEFTYQASKTRMITNLQTKSEHASVLDNSAYTKMLDVLAQEIEDIDNQHEQITLENNWSQARNISSLQTESKVHNYVPPRKRGATGLLRLSAVETFDAPPPDIIDIPAYTTFSNGRDIKFVTTQPYSIGTSDNYIDVQVVQGEAKSVEFIATGIANEFFTVNNDSIENNTVKEYINSVLWSKAEDATLLDYDGIAERYTEENKADFSGIITRTGDDVNGKKLISGDTVKIEYIETLGKFGNIVAINIIDVVDSTIYDINSDKVDLFCTNLGSLAGGEEQSDIEEIRTNSPRTYQAGGSANTKSSYEAILSDFTNVKKVTVWGTLETNQDNGNDPWFFIPAKENVVHVAIVSTTDDNLTDPQKLAISEEINGLKPPTDILQYEDVEFINLIFNVEAFVKNTSYTLTEAKTGISQALVDEYSIDNIEFNQNIYESDYTALIDNLAFIQYANITASFFKESDFDSAYAISIFLPMLNITGDTMKAYVKLKVDPVENYVLIGTANSSGVFTGEAGYNIAGSVIDPTTGIGAIIVNSGLTDPFGDYDVKITYDINNPNLLLDQRNYIFKYDSAIITADYYRGR